MQSYPINIGAGAAINVQIAGDNFVYESGTSTTAEKRIVIKPESGNEIVLRPGQQFRQTQESGAWTIRAYDAAAVITGVVIVGSGEFYDSNTNQAVTLDASFANEVTVKNTGANPVPITAAGSLNVQENLIAVTGSWVQPGNTVANTPMTIFTPAANANGAIVQSVVGFVNGASTVSVIAKAGAAPTDPYQGMLIATKMTAGATVDLTMPQKVRIPAGWGLYYIASAANENGNKGVSYTLL